MRPILIRWQLALLGVAALITGPVLADHDRHGHQQNKHYYDSQVRIYPAHHGNHNQRHDRRHGQRYGHGDYRPFRYRNQRRGHRQYRYYPRTNGYTVYERPRGQRRYYGGGHGHHDHYHRNRPLLRVLESIDRYLHCETHGGYFLREDLYYYN